MTNSKSSFMQDFLQLCSCKVFFKFLTGSVCSSSFPCSTYIPNASTSHTKCSTPSMSSASESLDSTSSARRARSSRRCPHPSSGTHDPSLMSSPLVAHRPPPPLLLLLRAASWTWGRARTTTELELGDRLAQCDRKFKLVNYIVDESMHEDAEEFIEETW